MNNYAGESPQKKIARTILYATCVAHGSLFPHPCGIALSLAGPEACELPALNCVIGSRATGVVVCDIDEIAVAAARDQGAFAVHGTLNETLSLLAKAFRGDDDSAFGDELKGDSLGFVHFDFMGHASDVVASGMRRAGPLLRDGSIVAWTFLRGREGNHSRRWRETAARVKQHALLSILADAINRESGNRDGTRVVGYLEQMVEWLRPGTPQQSWWVPISVITYHSGNSPMGIIAMKRLPVGQMPVVGPEGERGALWHDVNERWGDDVRGFAEWLLSPCPSGRPAFEQGVELLSRTLLVEKSTLIAWRAVATTKARASLVA